MRDLKAQVTSSLLQFPEGTLQALGKDEIAQGSVLCGKFSGGRSDLVWLARGPHLEIVNSVTGERFYTCRFGGVNEQSLTIRVVKEFFWEKRTGLLVALEEAERSILCLYDLEASEVVKAVVLPGKVIAVEPISNHGGPHVAAQHLHQSLQWFSGITAVATDVGHVFLVDLCLDRLSWSLNDIQALDVHVVATFPEDIPARKQLATMRGRHLCCRLPNVSGTPISTLCYISRINQLVVGFSDGCLSLWNMKTLKREHHCQLGRRIPVYTVTFQEPENDPHNCCYLWAVQSMQESKGDVLGLHLVQLTFGDRKRLASGQVMYEDLECCKERFSLDLTSQIGPRRGQSSNFKLLSCQTIEDFYDSVDKGDNTTEVTSPYTSISIFCWQVTTCGQEKPSTYLGVFDINCWYDAQTPDSIRPEELPLNCPYFALWTLDNATSMASPDLILDVLVHQPSLTWGAPPSYLPPDQILNASGYNFDGVCLLSSGVLHVTCTGFRKEEEQLEAMLSAAVQTGSLDLLSGCMKHWTSEKQPSSAANLEFICDCAWKKVIYMKDEFDGLCVPLFDGSCNTVDPQVLKTLQQCQSVLSNLASVLTIFQREPQEKDFADWRKKEALANQFSVYAQMVIWLCQSGLLPEHSDGMMHLSAPSYNYPVLQLCYNGQRQRLQNISGGKWDSDCLMIDGIVSILGDQVAKLWQREEGGTGKYPPPSLQALLDLYLLESIEETYKHAITIYLLLDIFNCWPNQIENAVKSFASTFALPGGFVKLIQGFWLLDHYDYEKSLAHLRHPETMEVAPWLQKRIIQSLACQGQHRQALTYLRNVNPPVSTCSEVQLCLSVLLTNRCVAEAWALLRQHATEVNRGELLKHVYERCQEMGLVEDLLRLPFTNTELECLKSFLQIRARIPAHEILSVRNQQSACYWPAVQPYPSVKINLTNNGVYRCREGAAPRNSILEHRGKVLPRIQRKLAVEKAKPYHLRSSLLKEASTPKLLSTVVTQGKVYIRTISSVIRKILLTLGIHV